MNVPRLLTCHEYDRLVRSGNVAAMLEQLAASPYADAAAEARARYVGVRAVAEACRRHLGESLRSLRALLGPHRSPIDTVLAGWDSTNLRIILRGQRSGAAADEILAVMAPAGELSDGALADLAKTTTPAQLLVALRRLHPVYAELFAAAQRDASSGELLESVVAVRFHRWRLDAASRAGDGRDALLRWLGIEADAHNVSVAMRARVAPSPATYVPGGSLEVATLEQVRQGNDAPITDVLARSTSFARNASPPGAHLATAIQWAAAKEVETEDVRWIAAGLHAGWSRGDIEIGLLQRPAEPVVPPRNHGCALQITSHAAAGP